MITYIYIYIHIHIHTYIYIYIRRALQANGVLDPNRSTNYQSRICGLGSAVYQLPTTRW